MAKHALLSASSSHRWLACPPSARLCEQYEDQSSEYAAEGTAAHMLGEFKLKKALGVDAADPTENLSYYNEEMEQCANDYAAYVLELLSEVRKTYRDPIVLIEQRLDYSRFVESGFGTGDCLIIGDGTLYVVDYKHGKGVEVSAVRNPQMQCYAIGALELFDGIYDINAVCMTIFQPRWENVSVFTMSKDELYAWAETVLAPPPSWPMRAKASSAPENTAVSARQRPSAASAPNITWNWPGMTLRCRLHWRTRRSKRSSASWTT